MATNTSGGNSRATRNTQIAMTFSAESRRCPKCNRKSALKFHTDDYSYGTFCRWDDCTYTNLHVRPWED